MKHIHHIIPRHATGGIPINEPWNLVELTIEEHAIWHKIRFDLYGDWEDEVAYRTLTGQIGKEEATQQTLSKSVTETNNKRIADGSHQFLGGKIQGETSRKRVANGTHNFIGGEISRRTQEKRVKEGTHPFLDKEKTRKRTLEQLEKGRHPSQIKLTCPHCNFTCGSAMAKKHHFDKCKHRR